MLKILTVLNNAGAGELCYLCYTKITITIMARFRIIPHQIYSDSGPSPIIGYCQNIDFTTLHHPPKAYH